MNVSKSFSVADPSLNNGAGNYFLSLKISAAVVDFCVFDLLQNMVVALESWNLYGSENLNKITEALERISETSTFLNHKFSGIYIIPDNSVHSLIPEKFFYESKAEKYTEFNYHHCANEKVCTDSLVKYNIKNTYWLPYELEELQNKLFPAALFRHVSTVLINSFLSDNNSATNVMAHFSGRRLDILVSKEGMLMFANSFNFRSVHDIAYYLVNVYKLFDLDVSVAPVQLSGDIENNSAAFDIIYKFIRNVSFAYSPINLKCCEELKDLPKHLHYILFNSFLCA